MSKLNIDQRTIKDYFSDKNANFLIPDYQRPYAWEEDECQTLWNDIEEFAFPDGNPNNFSDKEEYFLGPIVTYTNENSQQEVIDGQQRLTTLMLLLRASYERLENMNDDKSIKTKQFISQCLWKTDEFGEADKNILKINSEVATDDKKNEFLSILKSGNIKDQDTSLYAKNYQFFQKKINEFINTYPNYFSYFPIRILNNCILLPIEAESQDSALRIFSTLNDRGKPLADSDIFKAKLYKYFSDLEKKDEFIEKWKELEILIENSSSYNSSLSSMDDLFTRYMHYERAKNNIQSSSTISLRRFYESNDYSILKNEETFNNIIDLANFWNDIQNGDQERFSEEVLKKLFILENAPNNMWTYITSVYYLANKSEDGKLEEKKFINFLNKIIGFIWTYALYKPGVSNLRTPIYSEMVNLIKGKDISFKDYKFKVKDIENLFNNTSFTNGKRITRSLLTWWAFQNPNQELLPLGTPLQIEHIYSINRNNKEKALINKINIEKLGNKSLLERRINIRASDYRFNDKKKYYLGKSNTKKNGKKTDIADLYELANDKFDFEENDIVARNAQIISTFIQYLGQNNLLLD